MRAWGILAVENEGSSMYCVKGESEKTLFGSGVAPLRTRGDFGILPAILPMVGGMKRMSRGSPSSAKAD